MVYLKEYESKDALFKAFDDCHTHTGECIHCPGFVLMEEKAREDFITDFFGNFAKRGTPKLTFRGHEVFSTEDVKKL